MESNDYAWVQGFNYVPSYARNDIEFWRDYDPAVIEKELGYAKRLGLNAARPFLSYAVYKANPEKFIGNVKHFVLTGWKNGIYTMPVVFDSCFSEKEPLITADANEWFPNPGVMYLSETYHTEHEKYCNDLITALKDEKGLLLWDVHNEPFCTSYCHSYQGDEKEKHKKEILDFVLYLSLKMFSNLKESLVKLNINFRLLKLPKKRTKKNIGKKEHYLLYAKIALFNPSF
jgi:hypothetical protein